MSHSSLQSRRCVQWNGMFYYPGELREAKSVFGLSIDYDKVTVHEATAYFFQPNGTAITPSGEIYFPPADYRYSFATNRSDTAWLIHELTHVWQHRRGMWVRLRGMAKRITTTATCRNQN